MNLSLVFLVLFNKFVVCYFGRLCDKNYFIVKGMSECHPLLTCSDLSNVNLVKTIGYGAVKHVFMAEWNDIQIAYSVLKDDRFIHDFKQGLKMLKALNPSKYIVQLVGFCEPVNVILTEYHYFNNANNVKYLLKNHNLKSSLKLCLNYAEILNFLHNSPIGTRVNCDSNGLTKLLSQLLIKEDLSLILNDLDALPEITNSTIKCGQEIESDLITPEQLSSFNSVKGYTEKSDVWKFPNVCNYFLKESFDFNTLQFSIFGIYKRCKDPNPLQRPQSSYLVKFLKSLL